MMTLTRVFGVVLVLALIVTGWLVFGGFTQQLRYTAVTDPTELPSELVALADLGVQRGFAVLTANDGSTWLVIAAGEKPSSGYGISIQSVRSRRGMVTVTVSETAPTPNAMVLTVLTYPKVIVRLGQMSTGVRYSVVGGNGTVFSQVRPASD